MLQAHAAYRLRRRGSPQTVILLVGGSLAFLVLLIFLLPGGDRDPAGGAASAPSTDLANAVSPRSNDSLLLYCAAGMRYAVEPLVESYQKQFGVKVQVQYGGTNTLLSQLEVTQTGDLFLAADESYVEQAREKGLVNEVFPLAIMKPVVAVKAGNPLGIHTASDLLREEVKVAVGEPEAAAVGKLTQRLFSASGHWTGLQERVQRAGVFKPTVNDIANAVKLGSVDAGIIWDSTVVQYPELQSVALAELDAGLSRIELAVCRFARDPTAALRFARYAAAEEKGLAEFRAQGFTTVQGDRWSERPELTLFAGAVNRAALEPVVGAFERREGVKVNAVYNGCGILTATMRGIQAGQTGVFPDVYMPCDRYYLETIGELFDSGTDLVDTDLVLVTAPGNPKGIRSLPDLLKPGVRVVLGEPDKCTIGVLAKRLLQSENLYEPLQASGNLVNQTTSSALLVPQVLTGAADVVLAYRTDTRAESNRLEVVSLDSSLAKAIQPVSLAQSTDQPQLGLRLIEHIARSRESFEERGFNWRLSSEDTLRQTHRIHGATSARETNASSAPQRALATEPASSTK